MQKVMIIGNLGKDPETRYTQSGKAVTKFSVAVNEKYNGKESSEWFNCVAFDKRAETIGQYLSKGSKVFIEGKMKTDKYEKDGETRYSTSLIVNDCQFLDSRSGEGRGEPRSSQAQRPAAEPDFNEDFDDLPF